MDIKELEDYRLSDAVKFHTHLNPRIWGSDEHLLPEVRQKLLAIAADFKEFLGLDLEVKDITISGSNAAYTYTDHSDIDLHLITDLPKADIGELYRELFDAKKYQYNDQHDFTIGGYPVELYVQDASKDHKSQGIYSVVDNDWVSVPRRRQPDIDDISVKSKYEDLGHRIESAIKSGDVKQLELLGSKVREFRQAGLDQTGEFGPENLAFKVLRSNGTLDRLRAARQAARNQELSIDEAGKKKKKKSFRYGFGGYHYPGYNYYGQSDAATDGGGDAGTENVKESVDDIQAQLEKFAAYCSEKLGIENAPRIQLKRDPAWSQRNATFGRYMPEVNTLTLSVANRHPMDIMRTLAHELVHRRQDEQEPMPGHAGDTGSEWENEANAQAGVLMRDWGAENPGMFDRKPLGEGKESNIVWVKPNFDYEWVEIEFQADAPQVPSDVRNYMAKHFPDKQAWMKSVQHGRPVVVSPNHGQKIRNYTDNKRDLLNALSPASHNPQGPAKEKRVNALFDKGGPIEMPIILQTEKGLWLIGGNTRLGTANLLRGMPAKVWLIGGQQGVAEGLTEARNSLFAFVKQHFPSWPDYVLRDFLYQQAKGIRDQAELDDFLKRNKQDFGRVRWQLEKLPITLDIFTPKTQRMIKEREGGSSNPYQVPKDAERHALQQKMIQQKGVSQEPIIVAKLSNGYDLIEGWHRTIQQLKAFPEGYTGPAWVGYGATYTSESVQQVVAEASGYIPVTDAEARDPRYSMAITQDIKPGEVKRQAAKMGWKTTAAGTPPTARTNGLVESLQRRLQQVKADTLTEEQLDEVNMSPGALQSWAKEHAGGMKAGFEAELIFRDQLDDQADDEGDMEPDYDADERADSIDDIIEFFSAEMGRRAQDELRREMYENYNEWQADSILEAFDNRIHVTIKEYLEENDWDWQEKIAEYLQDEMGKTAEESDAIMNQGEENDDGSENEDYVSAMQAVEDQLDKRIDLAVQEGNDNEDWQGAYDDFAENFDNDEQDWLRSLGIRNMTDVDEHFSVDWPHWQSVDNGSSADGEYHRDTAELLATSLRNKFGVKTQVESSTRGDTAKRSTPGDVWVFEADGSLRPDDKTDMPVEIVSPPMPLKQTLAIMPEFFEWASSEGAYANKSTGLHMSVSMPEHAGDNLDYVKAALFLGDQYVLDQFGRAASSYSQSAIKEIKSKIDARRKNLIPADNLVTKAFDQMRTKLNSMATQAFARPSGFGKYFTINPKDKYIEFRSAGGKDYIEDIPKLQNTLLRYARAMSIGMDPAAEKQEYAKKLYKLLGNIELEKNPTGKVSVKPGEKDATWYFSQYVAGELTKERLKSAVKEIQQTRDIKKQAALGQQTYYEVTFRSGGDRVQKVMASSQKQAIALARDSWGIPARTHPGLTDDDFIAKATGPRDPLAPGQYSTRSQATDRDSFAYDPASDPAGNYVIRQRDSLGSDGTGPVIYRFNATGTSDALDQTRAWMAQRGLNRLDVWLSHSENVPPEILNAAPNLDTIPPSQATPPGMPASTQEGNWAMRNRGTDTSFSGSDGGGPILYQFQADSNSQAIDISRQYAEAIGVPRERLWLSMTSEVPAEYRIQPTQDTIIPPAGIADEDRTSDTGYWVVFDGATGSNLDNLAFLPARSGQDAQLAYRQWYQRTGYMFGSDARFIMRPGDHIDVQDARDRGLPTPPPMPDNLPQTLAPSSSDDNGRWQRTEWNIVDNDTGQVLHTFSGPGVTQGVANTMAAAWLEAEGPEDADMTEISVVPVPRSTIQDIPMDIAQNFQEPPASWDSGSPVVTEPQNFPAARSTGGEFTGQWNIVNSNTGEIVHTFGGAGNVQADANQAAARWARQTRFDDPIEVYPQMR